MGVAAMATTEDMNTIRKAIRSMDRDLTAETKARYNRIAPYYDLVEFFSERVFKRWRRKLLSHAKGKILEVGVGTGKNFRFIRSMRTLC